MQLDFEQRQLVNRAVTQARAHERQRFLAEAERLRCEMKAERDALLADVMAQCDALSRQLEQTQLEFLNFKTAVVHDKKVLADLARNRMLIAAQLAQRDPERLLQ